MHRDKEGLGEREPRRGEGRHAIPLNFLPANSRGPVGFLSSSIRFDPFLLCFCEKFEPKMAENRRESITDSVMVDQFPPCDWAEGVAESGRQEFANVARRIVPGTSFEAPAKLECQGKQDDLRNSSIRAGRGSGAKAPRKLLKHGSWSSDSYREEAWTRRKDQFMQDATKLRKAKSLTDEDLVELRGCIDLGFGFGLEEDDTLCNTLPALDFYYAINRQYNDCKSKSSVSTPECSIDRSSSPDGSPRSLASDTWRISSPGDNPQLVKTRLRHWAQIVACCIRQSS